ncbi:MAG TPA: phenylalanine--tRNA ligase subunit beta, partial [Roseiflexaceae bacterium]|nr:phenylalanine--tRNA ligase subunit beta [Roseiflexaceae bacterium]
IILPDDAPVGAPLVDYLGDAVLQIDILPNMARALSILGVAREVAALTGTPLRLPEYAIDATGPSVEGRVSVTIEEPDLCPRFTATLIEGVKGGQSPLWMQRRLTMAGMRPINVIVDISNYVMLELGQPNHTFDADKVADQHVIVRMAKPGETLVTLDGKEHTFGAADSPTAEQLPLLVCDPDGPTSIAGVMGGERSEVGPETTRILLEMAVWEPTQIRRTATALRLRSEASRRFERGVDIGLVPLAQRRALGLIQQLAGGTIAQGMVDAYPRPWQERILTLPPSEVRRILGIELTAEQIAAYLQPLGFECTIVETEIDESSCVRVRVPTFRQDVSLLADLCEEVARMYGYDNIPTTMLADELPPQRAVPEVEQEHHIRDVLVGAGLDEAITYSLTSMPSVAKITPADADPARYLKLANPLSTEREYLRRSLLPTLLEALADNLNERERVLLFEVGRVYLRQEGAVLPQEPRRLALAMAGARVSRSWLDSGEAQMDFFDLKGVAELVFERLGLTGRVRFVALGDDPRFHPGRAATVELADQAPGGKGRGQQVNWQAVGVLGELHPEVLERLEIRDMRVLAAEIDLDALIGNVQPMRYQPISRFPATTQDLSILVAHELPADQVAATIRKYAGSDLESLTLIDVYEGERIGKERRSMTYSLAFRSQDRTLSDADLAKVRARIIKGLEYDLKATLRS